MAKQASFVGKVFAEDSNDELNPFLLPLRFVFTDFAPNGNKQGVPIQEKENLIKSGLYMPVKVNFDGKDYYGHDNAFPIGPILEMYEEDGVLIAKAGLWKDEFEDFANFVQKAKASENGIDFSWEIYHKDSYLDESGTEWLKDCVVSAVTIVKKPAYKGRTKLIALAEEQEAVSELSIFQDRIDAMAKEIERIRNLLRRTSLLTQETETSDIQTVETVEEIELSIEIGGAVVVEDVELEQAEDLQAQISIPKEEHEALLTELEELRLFKKNLDDSKAQSELLQNRWDTLVQSGLTISREEFDRRSAFFSGMTDDVFQNYVESVSLFKPVKQSTSEQKSSTGSVIPDPLLVNNSSPNTVKDLAAELRKARSVSK